MRFNILGRRHFIAIFKSAVKGAQTFKSHMHGNIQHGHIAFQQKLGSLAAAEHRKIFNHGTAQMIMKQPGKAAFAVAKALCQCFHGQVGLIIFLQVNQHVLHLRRAGAVLRQHDADIGDQQPQQRVTQALFGFNIIFGPAVAEKLQHGMGFFVVGQIIYARTEGVSRSVFCSEGTNDSGMIMMVSVLGTSL